MKRTRSLRAQEARLGQPRHPGRPARDATPRLALAGAFLLLAPLSARGAPNADARIVLHAHPSLVANSCETPETVLLLDCDVVRPVVTVLPDEEIDVYVYLHSYDSVTASQIAFSWPSSWIFHEWLGSCRSRELAVETPQASGGSYIAAFDAVSGGQLACLGRLRFTAGDLRSTLRVVETWAPGGTGIVDANSNVFTTIPVVNRGVVAVGSLGVDSCGGESESSGLFQVGW